MEMTRTYVLLYDTRVNKTGEHCGVPPPRIDGNLTGHSVFGTGFGLFTYSAKPDYHDNGGQKTGGTFGIVSPTLRKWGGGTRPFHSFKGEVQICQRWSMRVRSIYGAGCRPD